jgi:hypothetical protein
MARKQFTGNGQLRLVPTISDTDLSEVTVAEITAGTNLTPFLTRDGISDRGAEAATVDVADATSMWDKTAAGTSGSSLEITLYRDSVAADDDAWAALPQGTSGYMVIAPFGFTGTAGAPAATNRIEVWPFEVSSRRMLAIAANESQKFTVSLAIPDEPNVDAAVIA